MVIYDHLTGSIWSQPYGAPIMGDLADIELDILPSTMTTWAEWRQNFPETLAYWSDYRYTMTYESDDLVLERSTIVARYFDEVASYPFEDLQQTGTANDVVGGLEIAVVLSNTGRDSWQVFSRRLPDGTVVEFESGGQSDALVDPVTQTSWDRSHGSGIAGPLSDQNLIVLPASMIFADQFLDYYPNGRIWEPVD